jgi:pimeloyl-ACP methyl ester carboxylesterase
VIVAPIEVRVHGGPGPTVVVLHGGPGAPGSVTDLATDLSDEFRVLEPWQRRSGEVALTVDRHVADLAAVLPEPAVVIGSSWGAMLGLSFAVAHPDLVHAVVLVGCGTYDEASRAAYHTAQAALGLAGAYEPDEHFDAAGLEETWTDVLRRQADGLEPAGFAAIRVPVLMLHGELDPHPGPSTRDVLREYLPQLEYCELAGCGHEPWRGRDCGSAFDAVLRGWLRANTGRARGTVGP